MSFSQRIFGAAVVSVVLTTTAIAQTSVVHFIDPSGLTAEARFDLENAGTTLRVALRNTSTGVPLGFTSADQILCGLSFDFGVPGPDPNDPKIVSGIVTNGPQSSSVNFSIFNVGPGADVSGEFGYGNDGSAFFPANFVSSASAAPLLFGGLNLHGAAPLEGPEGGLVAVPPVMSLSGEGVIQHEVIFELNLDQALADLGFLAANGLQAEFGPGTALVSNHCDHDTRVVVVPDPGGLNAPNALTAKPGSLPSIGNPNFTVGMDDPGNVCGIPRGSLTWVGLTPATASFIFPDLGCVPGTAGEIMINMLGPVIHGPLVPWAGPGSPACHGFPIPNDPTLCRVVCYGQGFFLSPARIVLTNRLDFIIGI